MNDQAILTVKQQATDLIERANARLDSGNTIESCEDWQGPLSEMAGKCRDAGLIPEERFLDGLRTKFEERGSDWQE